MKCVRCKTTKGLNHYIIADDMENPRPYCDKCIKQLQIEAMIKLGEQEWTRKAREDE